MFLVILPKAQVVASVLPRELPDSIPLLGLLVDLALVKFAGAKIYLFELLNGVFLFWWHV